MTTFEKLLAFQKKGVTLKRDGTNPHFKSSYVTLNEVLDKVKGPLNELGIVVVQLVEENGVRTRLIDTESTAPTPWIESLTPFVGATDMQKLGGAITYARRYSLISMLGLEDDDDDGNSAVSSSKPAKKGSVTEQTDEPFPDNYTI